MGAGEEEEGGQERDQGERREWGMEGEKESTDLKENGGLDVDERPQRTPHYVLANIVKGRGEKY